MIQCTRRRFATTKEIPSVAPLPSDGNIRERRDRLTLERWSEFYVQDEERNKNKDLTTQFFFDLVTWGQTYTEGWCFVTTAGKESWELLLCKETRIKIRRTARRVRHVFDVKREMLSKSRRSRRTSIRKLLMSRSEFADAEKCLTELSRLVWS